MTKPDKLHKFYKGRLVAKNSQELIEGGICPDCFNDLPDPVWENREGGYSEQVTYCPCGATYIS